MRKTTRITLAITVICMALAGCGSAPAHFDGEVQEMKAAKE